MNKKKGDNMKQTIKLRESELRRMISESVRRILKENVSDVIMTDGSATYDGCPIKELYFNGRICCVDEEGAIGFLLDKGDFSEEEVWRILKSIR